MEENKSKELMKYMFENYDVKTEDDVADALKDMLKDYQLEKLVRV